MAVGLPLQVWHPPVITPDDTFANRTFRFLVRFSTVGGESGSADSARDPRGFAMKRESTILRTLFSFSNAFCFYPIGSGPIREFGISLWIVCLFSFNSDHVTDTYPYDRYTGVLHQGSIQVPSLHTRERLFFPFFSSNVLIMDYRHKNETHKRIFGTKSGQFYYS